MLRGLDATIAEHSAAVQGAHDGGRMTGGA